VEDQRPSQVITGTTFMLMAMDAQDTSNLQEAFCGFLEKLPQTSSDLQEVEEGAVKVTQIFHIVDVEVRNISEQSVDIIGGQLKQFASQCQCTTSDSFILSVKHYKIDFENGEPQQCMPPKEVNFTQQDSRSLK